MKSSIYIIEPNMHIYLFVKSDKIKLSQVSRVFEMFLIKRFQSCLSPILT